MVIRLTTGAQIGGALRYNEQKVVQKQAHVLGATGFANNELAAKNRDYTTSVLESQSRKNPNVRKPALHFSLSLHPSEQVSDDKFREMAHQFMDEMDYQNQPYIIYRHSDTAHPHIHIVTTCVNESGEKINDSFIKRRVNEVRKKLELQFDLIKAQGRGKEKAGERSLLITPVHTPDLTQTKSQKQVSFDKKDQLEAILRRTFQQRTFGNIDEYRAQLKKERIHTVLHKSIVNGKPVRGISYQFTDEVGNPITPRIKASELGAWATWKEIEKQFNQPVQQHLAQKQQEHRQLTYEQYKALASLLSVELRAYKKEYHIYYDSALIEAFPTQAMRARLNTIIGNKLTSQEVDEAVSRFGEYKRAQLPEIIKKEQLAFKRTVKTYSIIGSEIKASYQNKREFFSALGVNLGVDGWISSPANRHLGFQMDPERFKLIKTDSGPDLKMPKVYSRGERTVLLLSESKKPFKESYYDVRTEQLGLILKPERMSLIHAQLNANYVTRLQTEGPTIGADQVRYFYQRGLVFDPQLVNGTDRADDELLYKIRYIEAPTQVGVLLGTMFERYISHLTFDHWQKGISTEAGKYMVALAQCVDQTKKTNGLSNKLTFLRERIIQRDQALSKFTNEELVSILEKRSLQGRGWIKQTDQESKLTLKAYMNESAIEAELLPIRAGEVFGYEQTGKFKNVGKGIKKRSKGREL